MKQIALITVAGVLIGGFFFFFKNWYLWPSFRPTTVTPVPSQKWETKTDNQASVTVAVTPIDLSSNSSQWKFEVVMNTHSVELNQDMAQVAVLIDDQGREYRASSWQGAGAGGHHREGVLIFDQIAPTPESVDLKISGIGNVTRSFVWKGK